MAKERGERGSGAQQQVPEPPCIALRQKQLLAQQKQLFPKLIFYLDAVQLRRYLEVCQHIFTQQHPVVLLHVHELDGKDVGGAFDLLPRHEQRQSLLLPLPPLRHRSQRLKRLKRTITQNTEQIQVGKLRVIISRDR